MGATYHLQYLEMAINGYYSGLGATYHLHYLDVDINGDYSGGHLPHPIFRIGDLLEVVGGPTPL